MSAEQGTREQALAKAFVTLADTLVADYDVIEMLHQLTIECVELLEVDAAGLLLSDQRGTLQMAAASTEQARVVELFELQSDEGPCLDCFRTSRPIAAPDLRDMTEWPRFIAHTLETGYRSVHAVPMRLRSETIGALNLFQRDPGALALASCASPRLSPTWPPSASCRNAHPPSARCSPSSYRSR